jgi:hypothetical protein
MKIYKKTFLQANFFKQSNHSVKNKTLAKHKRKKKIFQMLLKYKIMWNKVLIL